MVALCFAATFAGSVDGQTPRDSARALLRKADAAIGRETVSSAREAIALSRDALNLIGVADSPPAIAPAIDRLITDRAFLFTAMGYRILGVTDSTMSYVRRAVSLARSANDPSGLSLALTELGTALAKLGSPDSALVLLGEAVAIAETRLSPADVVATLIKLGAQLAFTGRLDSARVVIARGSALAAQQKMPRSVAHANRYLGGILDRQGRPDSSLRFYRVAERVFQTIPDSAGLSTVRTELSNTFYRLNLLDSALAYSALALEFQRAHGLVEALVASHRTRGILFVGLRRGDSALANQREALRLAQPLKQEPLAVMIESELAMQFARTEPESALVHGRAAFAKSRGLDVSSQTYANIALANTNLVLGRIDSALAYSRRAVELPRAQMSAELAYQVVGMYAVANDKARNHVTAAAYADSATALHSRVARATGDDFFRVAFGDGDASLYRIWTKSWANLEPARGVDARYASLAASERGRAQALLDLMTDSSRARLPGGDLAAEGRALTDQALRNADVVIAYQMLDDSLLVWSRVKGREVRADFIPAKSDSLIAAIRGFRSALGVDEIALGQSLERGSTSAPPSADWRAAGRALRRLLVPNDVDVLLTSGKHVVIIPTGPIGVVPFAALPRANGARVLGDDVSIRYAPSLATLAAVEQRPAVTTGRSLVVSNPSMPEAVSASGVRRRLGPLPGAEVEGREVAKRLASTAFSGAAATESFVRAQLPQSRIVHIASHGYAYATQARARDSFIALAPDGAHEGLLTVAEIMGDPDLRLNAELVTLSACESGLGDLRQAEGTIGLQRAFLARGARTLLVSLWSVSDAATRLLMDRFYAHWVSDRDKPDKAESLRRAQADVKKQPRFGDAKFWAAFQIVGAR